MTPEEKIHRGAEAQRILSNPLLTEAFVEIESALMRAWHTPPAMSSTEMREGVFLQVQALRKLRDTLTKYVSDGKVEEMTIQQRDARDRAVASGGSGTA